MEIGLHRGMVALEPHRVEWETAAQETINQLKDILGEDAIDIQHIGSTSIRSICAKPIIDIVIGVADFENLLKHNARMEEAGFHYCGGDVPNQQLYVCGDMNGDIRTHHIHGVIWGDTAWQNYRNMRDYLNSHEEDARAYAELKTRLAAEFHDDRKAYTAAKGDFIAAILQKAAAWRKEE